MADEFQLGKNGQFGKIDFSKLKQGLKKEDVTGGDANLESIWEMIDGDGNNVLDRKEVKALRDKIAELAGEDKALSKKEGKKFTDEDGEKVGKKGREALYGFLNKLAEKTKDVNKISYNIINGKECQIVKYNNNMTEYLFDDGSKIVEENGTKTHYDKDGKVTKTEVQESDKTTVTSFDENNKVKRKEVTLYDGCREVEEYENGELAKKTTSTPTGDKVEETVYKDGEPVSRTVIETANGNKTKKVYDGNSDEPKEVVENYGDDGYQITTKYERKGDSLIEHKTEEAIDRESKTTFNSDKKRTEQVVKVKGGKTYTVKYDGKGNTYVVLQMNEKLEDLAAKFGCTVEQIRELNGGKTKFLPGDEILVPKELEADADILKGRKSATEARADYNKAVEIARKKREAAAAAEAKRKAEAEAARQAEEAKAKAKEPSYTEEEIKIQKESAKQIVADLKKAIRGYNDHGAIKSALARIDHPIELEEVNNLLAAEGYESSDMYSSVEKFINNELQRVETDFSCEELETLVQNWIDNGLLKGQAAIDAQARLAARVICDGGDGFGTDCEKIKKGIYMIKAPAGQGSEAAKKVYEQVNKIIANHNTFYGIGTKCKDLMDYLDGEMWGSEIKYLKGILAENDAVQGAEKAEAVSGLVEEAVDGAGTDIDALKQAIKGIKTPEDRKAVEAKLAEYCEKKGIKPQIQGQSALQAIMYTECDTFMGFSTDHAEIRKFNEMLIEQGAYSKSEATKIRAEQAALQILEGDFDNIQDAVKNIKDKEVLVKLDELLKTKGYDGLDDFLNKKLVQSDMDLVNAELASNNLLPNDKAVEVAFRLVQDSDFDTRAMGLKAIRNEQVAKQVDAKLREIGLSLNKIYDQFNKEKAEYKQKAAIWDGLAGVIGWAEHISDKYRENTDVSDNIYVEADNAVQLTPEQKQAYQMTIKVFEEKLAEMKKSYEEALASQGLVSDAVNAFCERWNIGTTRDEIEARIEHDTETLRLLKLAADGKLSKIVDGKTVSVTFEDVFKERQAEKVTASGVSATGEVNNDFEFSAEKVAKVAQQAERMGAMSHLKNTIASCWADLDSGLADNDLKRLAVGIYNTLQKLGELNGSELTLESFGYKLNSEGIIVDKEGKIVPPQELRKIVDQLKTGLADMANNIFGKGITTDMNADSVKSLLDEGYEEEIEKFKDEYREAFNQEPTDEMVNKYIETINTGKTVVNFGTMIGAAVLAPFTGGGSLAVFAAVAGTSMAVNALEKSTDSDGYTNLEWTSDAEQALWDGAMTAAGMKIGQFADKFAKGALNIKAAQSLLAKNKALLSTMIKNPATLEKAAVWVARVEAAGFEVSSDTLQSLVQMYCQEGEFNEEAFLQGLVMSVTGNAIGHGVEAKSDIKATTDSDVTVNGRASEKPNNVKPSEPNSTKAGGEAPNNTGAKGVDEPNTSQGVKGVDEPNTPKNKKGADATDEAAASENISSKEAKKARREEIRAKVDELKVKYGRKLANAYGAVLRGIDSIKNQVDLDKIAARIQKKFADVTVLKNDLMAKLKVKAEELKLKFNDALDKIKGGTKTTGAGNARRAGAPSDVRLTPNTAIKIDVNTKVRLADHVDIDLNDLKARFSKMKDGDSFYIGRTADGPNDIQINNPYISGKHIKIEKINGEIYITDLGSKNGTTLNTSKPDYAAKWKPDTAGKYSNAKAYDFNRKCDEYYDELRRADYTYEQSVNKNIRQSDVMPDSGIIKNNNIIGYPAQGWFWRSPRRVHNMSKLNIVDRISLNVKADKKMLEELDNLMQNGTYVNKQGQTVKVEVPQGYYKTPQTLTEWGTRHDPITMYFDEKISDELAQAIADITEKYARTPSNGKALMNSLPGKPWIAHEEYIPASKAKALYDEAKKLNPELADGIFTWVGADDGWNCSTGMYAAAKRMVDEYKLSMGKTVNADDFVSGGAKSADNAKNADNAKKQADINAKMFKRAQERQKIRDEYNQIHHDIDRLRAEIDNLKSAQGKGRLSDAEVKKLRDILDIPDNVELTPQVLKEYYRKAALKNHPDASGSDAAFQEVNNANAALKKHLETKGPDNTAQIQAKEAELRNLQARQSVLRDEELKHLQDEINDRLKLLGEGNAINYGRQNSWALDGKNTYNSKVQFSIKRTKSGFSIENIGKNKMEYVTPDGRTVQLESGGWPIKLDQAGKYTIKFPDGQVIDIEIPEVEYII